MLHYPKIPSSGFASVGPCIAFDKLDGTNVHFDWHRDFGWHAFGTRRDEYNLDALGIERFVSKHQQLRECAKIFKSTLASGLEEIFQTNAKYRDAISIKAFAEFFGPNSFAGLHVEKDPKELRLFDIEIAESGMVVPKEFVVDFGHLSIPKVIFIGKFTGKFADDVRNGKYDVREGVVCKGGKDSRSIWMAKIKTNGYMQLLKSAFAEKWEDYWE